jgi:NhaP-type Na+/H+ or K+/H+ antiporter
MTNADKLRMIKIAHTAIWIFFNIVIFYMLYAAITGKLDKWLWIGYGLIILEGLTLWAFNMFCPLTVWARKYSDDPQDNFDIYLPNWLARHNKTIYTSIVGGIAVITLYRLLE